MRPRRLVAVTLAAVGLALSAPAMSAAAVLPAAPPPPTKLAAGSQFACAILKGTTYCWGRNHRGQLGVGANAVAESAYPVPVDVSSLPAGVSFVSLAGGIDHMCAVTNVGTLYCWGADDLGSLGNGDASSSDQRAPVPVDVSLLPVGTTFSQLVSGRYGDCALTPTGSVYCWGDTSGGQLGTGAPVDGGTTRPTVPVAMTGLPAGDVFASIDYNDTAICGVTTSGAGYCWGEGAWGQTGTGATADRLAPTPINLPNTTWTAIQGGERFMCGITTTAAAYCWGADSSGQLGNGPDITGDQSSPTAVVLPAGVTFTGLGRGVGDDSRFMCGLTAAGAAYCWGSNDNGQLGYGVPNGASTVPVATTMPEGVTFTEVSAGTRYACALTAAEDVYCWGQGANGKLGNGGSANRTTPTKIVVREGGRMRITEWMYNTAADTPGEWVELTNVGDVAVDMTGWRYDDDSASYAAGFDLSGFGKVEPGESVVFTEVGPAAFRADWGACDGVKVLGPYSNNLGRADQINLFDADGALVDRLTYGDQTIGGPRTNGTSAWVPAAALGADDARQWTLSAVGDGEGAVLAASGSIGSPGASTRATAAFDPCAGRIRITEWMYNTAADNAGEWVELTNVGYKPVDMTGWSYDDDSRNPGVFGLAAFGVVEPGESIVFTEVGPELFKADWDMCPAAKVIGPYSNNLGRADEINIYDAAGELADRLNYGDQRYAGSVRTQGFGGWVTAAGLGANNALEWRLASVGDAEGSIESVTGSVGSPGRSTRAPVAFTRCGQTSDAPRIERDQTTIAGSLGDPENPALTLTLTPKPGGAPVEQLTVTVTSSNDDVLDTGNITLGGAGATRTVHFDPQESGTTTLVFTVADPDGSRSAVAVGYAASQERPDESGHYYHRISDASSALDVGDGYVLLLNDETNTIFLYRADHTGLPVKTWDFTAQELGTGSEIDFEGLARSGDLLVLTGSHGNNREGEVRPERRTLVTATITGSGAQTEIAFRGRTTTLWGELRAWDQANGDALGLIAASAPGVEPNAPDGFNIEGLEFAPDGQTLYLGLRAPTVGGRAVIVPLNNLTDVIAGAPAQFGAPNLLDLGGRSIRELRRNASNQYLIAAGPSPSTDSWALYTWDATHAPRLNQMLPEEDFSTGGSWESIAAVPENLVAGGPVRLVTDSGDTDFYGTGATKDLATGYQKSYTRTIALNPVPVLADGSLGATVPATLALTLGAPASFGSFVPGIAQTYEASTTANVVSTAGDAALTVADPSQTATGHLVNGAFVLASALAASVGGPFAPVGGSNGPTVLKHYDTPVSNDALTIAFRQTIAADEALRTGAYAKTLTFTLSTTTP